MRKHIFSELLIFGIAILLFGCNMEEEFITEKNHQQNVKIRYLYGKEALNKSKNLESKISSSGKIRILSRTDIALTTDEGTVDYTKVLEVIDENNNVNYTFDILNHPEDSETVFHNLILSNENTAEEEILLLKYESETSSTSIVNFNGTITTKSISTATNPCDTSTHDVDFTGFTGSDNGSATGIPGDNNVIVTPPTGGGNGGNSGNTFSDDFVIYDCNSSGCNFRTTDRTAMLNHYAPQGFTAAYYFGRQSNTTETNPCDPNGNIGIINDSVVKTPCESLTINTNNSNYKTKFNNLNKNEKFTASQESGFELVPNTVGGHYNRDLLAVGNKALKPSGNAINFTHVHNNQMKHDSISGLTFDHGVKMLSPPDIDIMSGDMLNNNTTNGTFAPTDTFAVMISNEGIFAVVPTVSYIPILKVDYDNFYNNYYEKAKDIIITNRATYNTAEKRKNALEKMMLKLINETPGYKGKIELFEGDATDPNNIKWTKKTLNASDPNIVDQTPC